MPLTLEEAIDFIDDNAEETGFREILELWNGTEYIVINLDFDYDYNGYFEYHFSHEKTKNWFGKLNDIAKYANKIPAYWAEYNDQSSLNYNHIKFLPFVIIELTLFEKFILTIKICPETSMNSYFLDSNGDDSDSYFIIMKDIMNHFPREHYVELIPDYDLGDEDEYIDENE